MPVDGLVPTYLKQLRHGHGDWLEDLNLYRSGVLDLASFCAGLRPMCNPVEVVVRHGRRPNRLGPVPGHRSRRGSARADSSRTE